MNPIDQLFDNLRTVKRKAFMPFLTAGDPNLQTTGEIIRELAESGSNLIEFGFPYSDPIADGSVIQASYTRALEYGIRVDDIFEFLHKLTKQPFLKDRNLPLVGMISGTLVHKRGGEKFVQDALACGLSGAIIPDVPFEESEELADVAKSHDFKLIQLVTPTTPRERAKQIVARCTGFVYCVSVTGITGERSEIPAQLTDQLAWLRGQTDLPLCVGFGISRPEHVQRLRDHCDGVIVGSALVRRLEKYGADTTKEIGELVQALVAALNPA